jgi:hypothetical protein
VEAADGPSRLDRAGECTPGDVVSGSQTSDAARRLVIVCGGIDHCGSGAVVAEARSRIGRADEEEAIQRQADCAVAGRGSRGAAFAILTRDMWDASGCLDCV